MTIVESRSPAGIALGSPRVADSVRADGRVTLDAFVFTVERTVAGLAGAEAALRLEPPSGERRTFRSRLAAGAAPQELRFEAHLPLAANAAGEFRATLTVGGAGDRAAFEGVYTFGYPRYE